MILSTKCTDNPKSVCCYFWTKGAMILTSHLCSDGFVLWRYPQLVWSLSLQIWFMSTNKLFSQNKLLFFPINPWWCYYLQSFFFANIGIYRVLLEGVLKDHFLLPFVANCVCHFLPQWRRWLSWSPEVWRCYQAKTTSIRYQCVSHSFLLHFIYLQERK